MSRRGERKLGEAMALLAKLLSSQTRDRPVDHGEPNSLVKWPAAQPWTSFTSRERRAYPNKMARPIQTLFRRAQLWPASRATWPPSTTAPSRGALPLGRLRRALVSGEHFVAVAPGSGISWPVPVSMRLSFIHFQFSWSSSGHSERNFRPPSPALTLFSPLTLGVTPGVEFI